MEYALRLGETAADADDGGQVIARAFESEVYGARVVPDRTHEMVRAEWPAVRWALIRRSLIRLIGIKPRPPLRVALANPVERPLYSRTTNNEVSDVQDQVSPREAGANANA